ncbi:peptidase M16 [Veronia nyctiphanis]|uniref:Peptidase M16 n=1 Tax=Veronia nyctiphanis TaxID=1278244 RepID=A0A4Q0YM42_9GAMM|nr:peptidase M16 [Veronia nyctiphanis]
MPPIEIPEGINFIEQGGKRGSEPAISYQKYQLDNGLTLLLHEDHSDPLVHLDVTYHVGSAREEAGRSGFAHFFEHMMFQGSKHVGDQQHIKLVTEAGGSLNGTTNRDRTNYYEIVPANQLEKMLWLESDRMGFLLEAVSKRKFEIQRATVKNEKAQNFENRPYGMVSEKIAEALYPSGHPYSHPTIGYIEDLNQVDVDDLKAFFLRWYGPNNATLTIGGDIDVAQTLKWVKKYFGDIPPGPVVEKQPPQPVTLPHDVYLTLEDKVQQPMLVLTWPTANPSASERFPLDMLTSVIGQGRNSLLYQQLVKTGKVLSVGVNQDCGELACSIQLYALGNQGQNLKEIYKEVMDVLAQLNERGISNDDLSLVKGGAESSAVFSLQSVSGKVSQLASNEVFYDQPNRLGWWLDSIENVTTQRVERAFEQYIWQKPAVILSVVPEGESMLAVNEPSEISRDVHPRHDQQPVGHRETPETFDRSVIPPEGKPVFGRVPSVYSASLSNGMQVIGTESRETPTITLELLLPAGGLREPDGQQGLAELTAAMVEEGSIKSSGENIEAKLDRLGSYVGLRANREYTVLTISTLKKHLYPTLRIAVDLLSEPKFSEEDFARNKRQMLEGLAFAQKSAKSLADSARREVFYKNAQHRISPGGNISTVSSLTLDNVKAFYKAHYTPKGARAVIVGDITEKHALSLMNRLSFWNGSEGNVLAEPEYKTFNGQRIWLKDNPGATQSIVQFVRKGMPYDATGEMFKTQLANFNLGGNFNGRINQNLREDKGYTYGASGYVFGNQYSGLILFQAEVRRDVTGKAIQEFIYELDRMAADGVTEQELTFMRKSIAQGDALDYETPSQKAGLLANLQKYGLSTDYKQRQQEIVSTVTAQELNALAKRWFTPDDCQIIVVGDAATIMSQLEKTGIPVTRLLDEISTGE